VNGKIRDDAGNKQQGGDGGNTRNVLDYSHKIKNFIDKFSSQFTSFAAEMQTLKISGSFSTSERTT